MYKYIDVASARLGYKTIHFLFGVQVFFFFFIVMVYIYGFNCNTIINFIFCCCCFYSLYYELGTQRLGVTSQTLRTARHTPPKKKFFL